VKIPIVNYFSYKITTIYQQITYDGKVNSKSSAILLTENFYIHLAFNLLSFQNPNKKVTNKYAISNKYAILARKDLKICRRD